MQRNPQLRLFLGLGLALIMGACSASKNQNPVGSGEETGKVSEDGSEQPTVYVTKAGENLRKIAARPEIYGDPNLWPVLQEANADRVGEGIQVNKGVELQIPRNLSQEQKDMAHEKARQVAAANKMSAPRSSRRMATPEPEPAAPKKAPAKAGNEPTPAGAAAAQPVPQAKKGGVLLPVLFVLLLILAGLAGVLFYFMKKEKKEDQQG